MLKNIEIIEGSEYLIKEIKRNQTAYWLWNKRDQGLFNSLCKQAVWESC